MAKSTDFDLDPPHPRDKHKKDEKKRPQAQSSGEQEVENTVATVSTQKLPRESQLARKVPLSIAQPRSKATIRIPPATSKRRVPPASSSPQQPPEPASSKSSLPPTSLSATSSEASSVRQNPPEKLLADLRELWSQGGHVISDEELASLLHARRQGLLEMKDSGSIREDEYRLVSATMTTPGICC